MDKSPIMMLADHALASSPPYLAAKRSGSGSLSTRSSPLSFSSSKSVATIRSKSSLLEKGACAVHFKMRGKPKHSEYEDALKCIKGMCSASKPKIVEKPVGKKKKISSNLSEASGSSSKIKSDVLSALMIVQKARLAMLEANNALSAAQKNLEGLV